MCTPNINKYVHHYYGWPKGCTDSESNFHTDNDTFQAYKKLSNRSQEYGIVHLYTTQSLVI